MAEFLFYDYETFGISPKYDRIAQFAAIRTDSDFNIIGEPINIYCQQADDYVPSPEAILITGITPDYCNEHGLPEHEFARRIYDEFMKPDTCVMGFNSIRFDDEMTRYLFYRNFFDPYAYAWKNGNSRWDALDLVRGVYALRPEGIEWPKIDGQTSLKLESLTKANGLSHDNAHDALSDVDATIDVLKLIKEKQPRFYDYFYQHRRAKDLLPIIEQHFGRPLVHVSGMFGEHNGYLSVVVPLTMHPWNKNAVVVVDLRGDLDELLNYSAEEIKAAMYTANEDLGEGRSRVPLKLIHLNKCPIISPVNVLKYTQNLYGLDLNAALDKVAIVNGHHAELERKAREIFAPTTAPSYDDQPLLSRVESMLYDGFFEFSDKKIMEEIPYLSEEALKNSHYQFKDARIAPLLFLYRAKNFPMSLTSEEYQEWEAYCDARRERTLCEQQAVYTAKVAEYADDPVKSKLLADCRSLYFE